VSLNSEHRRALTLLTIWIFFHTFWEMKGVRKNDTTLRAPASEVGAATALARALRASARGLT
jgi:hypothetical protein